MLRLLFILAGGLLGPLGIAGMFFCMLVSASGMHAFGIPYLAPIAPSTGGFLRDEMCIRDRAGILQANEAELKEGVNANLVVFGSLGGITKEWDLNGEAITLGVEKL